MSEPVKIVTPIGMIGYGYEPAKLYEGLRLGATAIICDAGSTDSGPQKLALGTTTCPHASYVQDLSHITDAVYHHKVKAIITSAGGDGSDEHVDEFVEIIQDHCLKNNYRLKVVKIYASVDKSLVLEALDDGKITPCGAAPELDRDEIKECVRIVGQMGMEPFVAALKDTPDVDIIIAGRAYDPSPYAAYCVANGMTDLGVAYHMGKVLECGAQCGSPKTREALATIWPDRFEVTPLQLHATCTPESLAAHSLYENSHADLHPGPGGSLDLTNTRFYHADDRSAGASGQLFHISDPYTIKLEGARVIGFRTVFLGSIRDRILISQIDTFLEGIKKHLKESFQKAKFDVMFRVYGKNGTMGPLDDYDDDHPSKELFLICEVLADSQELANHIAAIGRIAIVHGSYPGQKATGGNFAMPLTPLEIPLGPVSTFNVYHLLPVDDPVSLFPRITVEVGCAVNAQSIRDSSFGFAPIASRNDLSNHPKSMKNGLSNGNSNGSLHGAALSHTTHKTSAKPINISEKADGTIPLTDLARVIRSKNAGPFELTFDVIFNDLASYAYARQSLIFTRAYMANLYCISEKDIIACQFFEPARAFKFTIPRPWNAGSFGDRDIHCSQQHAPLLDLRV